jgi:hypothetical protein
MKIKCTIVLLCMVMLSVGIVCSAEEVMGEQTYISEYQGKKYVASMPSSVLINSPDFEDSSTTLPKSLKDIVAVAKIQLDKITKADQTWELHSITFNQWCIGKKKWYYAVGFQSKSNQYITILVTIDGRLGIIKEISEKIID